MTLYGTITLYDYIKTLDVGDDFDYYYRGVPKLSSLYELILASNAGKSRPSEQPLAALAAVRKLSFANFGTIRY